jgi:electron transfer flavoprotein alpha/beta subunit
MAAAKKKVTAWTAADLALESSKIGAAGRRVQVRKLFVPVKEGKCDVMAGDTPAEKAAALGKKLREAKLV